MRVLLVHPEDRLEDTTWSSQTWHRIVDLGRGSPLSYERLGQEHNCSVAPLDSLRNGTEAFLKIRHLLALGFGRLLDRHGLDWWELTSIMVQQQMETVILLRRFAETLTKQDEVYVSRPGFYASVMQTLLGPRVHVFPGHANSNKKDFGHYFRTWRKLSRQQLFEIAGDKWDPGYQFRGRFVWHRPKVKGPVVLLPTAYGNVSRTEVAYALASPETQFLLVATRRSGWSSDVPPNVTPAWLCSYASLDATEREKELSGIAERWGLLRRDLQTAPEFATLERLGLFNDFPRRFRHGLEVRDAWRNVFDTGAIQAVLCADDTNPFTHIPLLLAANCGLPTVSSHHGALDGRYCFKRPHADVILAKGEMELDYLVRYCGVPRAKVEVGAPAGMALAELQTYRGPKPFIVFFSEAYEVASGRPVDFYREILPPLADLALAHNREVLIKLHPFERLSERSKIVDQVLHAEQKRVVRLVEGKLDPGLLTKTWFGITVLSTVASECALQGVPCFLCKWLDFWPYGYVDQFIRFRAGIRLDGAAEIEKIPGILATWTISKEVQDGLWTPISSGRLKDLLGASRASVDVVRGTV